MFKPLQADYFENLYFGRVKIEFVSMKITGISKELRMYLIFNSNEDNKIVITDSIAIVSDCFETYKINSIGYVDLQKKRYSRTFYFDGPPYIIFYKNVKIIISCILENKKEIHYQYITNLLKKTKLKVRLPSIIIDDKKYQFKELDFVYSR